MSTAIPSPLGHTLRRMRLRSGFSQDELAARAGVSARAISDIERGQRPSAHFETLRMLADALTLSTSERRSLFRAARPELTDITLMADRMRPAPSADVPPQSGPTVGRDCEIAELVALLTGEAGCLVTLTGPGGVGKSRIAATVANRLQADFAQSISWVDLTPVLEPEAVPTAIFEALGIETDYSQPPSDQLAACFDGRRSLLIIDNFEQVLDAAPLLAQLHDRADNLSILVTSRARLRLTTEREFRIDPLSFQGSSGEDPAATPAVQLFAQRASDLDPSFDLTSSNAASIAAICERLDGLPLAIELAASRLDILSLDALLHRLESRLPLLTLGGRDMPARQQTMRDTIAWSYDLLDPATQALFRRLSIFPGGFNVETAEWMSDSQGAAGVSEVDGLTLLSEHHLIAASSHTGDLPRFTMLETLREFGLEQLHANGEYDAAVDRMVTYCRALARYGEDIPTCVIPAAWIVRLDQERDNIRAARRFVIESGDTERLLEYVAAFGHYLYLRGPSEESLDWLTHALNASKPDSTPVRLQALYWASHTAKELRLTREAFDFATTSLAIAEELGDIEWQAASIHCQAQAASSDGDRKRAVRLWKQELALWRRAGVPGLSAFAYLGLSGYAYGHEDYEQAWSLQLSASDLFEQMEGYAWVALSQCNLGYIALAQGDREKAASHLQSGLDLAITHQAMWIVDFPLSALAAIASEAGCEREAAMLAGASDRLLIELKRERWANTSAVHDRAVARCRQALGDEQFEIARRRGEQLSLDDCREISGRIATPPPPLP